MGSVKKNLREHPEKERALWRILEGVSFESSVAAERISDTDVLASLDYEACFNMLGMPIPASSGAILEALQRDDMITPCDAGGWDITNLGAILFANKLG